MPPLIALALIFWSMAGSAAGKASGPDTALTTAPAACPDSGRRSLLLPVFRRIYRSSLLRQSPLGGLSAQALAHRSNRLLPSYDSGFVSNLGSIAAIFGDCLQIDSAARRRPADSNRPEFSPARWSVCRHLGQCRKQLLEPAGRDTLKLFRFYTDSIHFFESNCSRIRRILRRAKPRQVANIMRRRGLLTLVY